MGTNAEATRDWTPPTGEFRPSALGACARYAWEQMRVSQIDRAKLDAEEPIGRTIMMAVGHEAERVWIDLVNERENRAIVHGVTLYNGYNGYCHPDAVSWRDRKIYEIKHTGYKSPAPYHIAQLEWYLMRMAADTGRTDWSGVVVLLDKYGKDPLLCEVPFPDAERQAELIARAESHLQYTPPEGICSSRQQALTKAKYYCKESSLGARTEIRCPHADKCFAPDDDFGV